MAYKKASKKSPKKMQMGGDYMEPNKELTFGGMKGKYQAAGPVARQMENAKKAKAAAERIEAEKRAKDKASSTSGIKGVGRPTIMNTSPNVKTKLDELSKAPGPKPASDENTVATSKPKAAPEKFKGKIKGPKKIEDNKTERSIKKPNVEPIKAKGPSKIKSSTSSPTLKTKKVEAPKSKREERINKRTQKVTDRKMKMEKPTRLEKKEARIDKRTDRVMARKEKKAGIKAAKARLKAARRLQSGGLKDVPEGSKGKGLSKLPTAVRNKMGFKRYGGNK